MRNDRGQINISGRGNSTGRRLIKFCVGLVIFTGLVLFFSSGYTPPGICGEVLRHNQEYNIDASPFFYGDVENMHEYEEGVKKLREEAKRSQSE